AFLRQIDRDQSLLAVLAAPDVVEVVHARPDRLPEADRAHLELEATGRSAARKDGHVPAICVDVQVVGIEVADPDTEAHAARSQYCGTLPRRASTLRSASIAV